MLKERLHHLLRTICKFGASDLHLSAGLPPVLRMHGHMNRLQDEAWRDEELRLAIREITTDKQWAQLERNGELDVSYELEGVSRFRLNIFQQRGTLSIAVRVIAARIPSLDELALPPICKTIASKPNGLVLVTGPTGSGKSTTLAAMVHYINETMRKHIITLEDPIEYVHHHGQSIVQQREVGHDTQTFASGLRAALRQDPDVILVGELRDSETMDTAITAAETGHLVFATLHTMSAAATIERMIGVFPGEQQNKIRLQLATVLQAVIAQQLFSRSDGRGRTAVTEVMLNNQAVANLIRSEKLEQIPNAMLTGRDQGMHTFEERLREYVTTGIISYEAALPYLRGGK